MQNAATNEEQKDRDTSTAEVLEDLRDGQEVPKSQSRRVLLKIDLVIMPLIVLAMTLAFLDKVPLPTTLSPSLPFCGDRHSNFIAVRTPWPTQPSSAWKQTPTLSDSSTAG